MQGNLYLGERKTSGADFDDRVQRLAAVMQAQGVCEDDAVAILMRNDTAYIETVAACRLVGAYYATLNWHSAPAEIAHILSDSQAKILVGHSDLLRALAAAEALDIPVLAVKTPKSLQDAYSATPELAPGHLDLDALMMATAPKGLEPLPTRGLMAYTSGSTGRPKGIQRTRPEGAADMFETLKMFSDVLMRLTPGDRFYTPAPLYHSAPNMLSNCALSSGKVDIHIAPKFDAEGFLAYVEKYAITHIYIVPTMMVRMLKLPQEVRERYDVSSLRYSISTGSAWPKDVKDAMIDWFGPIFFESYGASEIGFITLISSEEAKLKPNSVGKVLPGGDLKILDDDMNELPPGQPGSIYAYLPMFGDFAYTNSEGDLSGQRAGIHATVGDIGYLDEDDYLYISDRKKDMIISGGANIFPAEIEAALIKMPEVFDCAVFGAPDPEYGERIIAAVQCVDGAAVDLSLVQSFLAPHLAKFKIPRAVDVHDALPREDSGKIFKQRLRDPYWQDSARNI